MQPFLCCFSLLGFKKRRRKKLLKYSPIGGIYSLPFSTILFFPPQIQSIYLVRIWKSKTRHYKFFRVYEWSQFPSDCFLHQLCAHCSGMVISLPGDSPATAPKSICSGVKNTSHCILFLCCLLWLIAKFPIERAGQQVIQLYPKLMPDDTDLWCGWAKTSLSDACWSAVCVVISLFSSVVSVLHQLSLAPLREIPAALEAILVPKSKGWLTSWFIFFTHVWPLRKKKNQYKAKCIYTSNTQDLCTSVVMMKALMF